MAIVLKNLVTQGLSGKLGGSIVFRHVGETTVVSSAPIARSKPPTESQQSHQRRFQQAVIYAKGVIADPEARAAYEEQAKKKDRFSAYNIAVADFFNAPNIEGVDLSAYDGKVGDTIVVRVTDDFQVKAVVVEIHNPDGSLVESTEAVKQANGLDWLFTATVANEDIDGDRIMIKASDLPGNVTSQEQVLVGEEGPAV